MTDYKNEWIDVNDRLPDDYGWFLVIDKYLTGNPVTMGFYEGPDNPEFWLPVDGRYDSDSMKVAYWMPLPSPPITNNGE
tara:strand:- start:494 stop:730 length:237 start_codon:yes stop_codon:yes gene_type:complete